MFAQLGEKTDDFHAVIAAVHRRLRTDPLDSL
jgi:hypothetical protein